MGSCAMNVFRRLPLSRLLISCALFVAVGVSVTALASAVSSGPTPPAKPLANAVHDALTAAPVEGVSANITLTNHLIEGANLASAGGQGGEVPGSALLNGGSGRMWIAKDGRVRLELQSEKGDTQVIYDGHTVSLYDASSNTLYRYTPSKSESLTAYAPLAKSGASTANKPAGKSASSPDETPSVAKIEEAITHAEEHAKLSGATPATVAGQPAYTVRVSPKEGGSLLGGAELSFDSVHGVPLRTAIYSSTSSSPVIELAATEVSYGPVASSVFSFTPPTGAKIEELKMPTSAAAKASKHAAKGAAKGASAEKPAVATHGNGLSSIAVLESKVKAGSKGSSSSALESLPKVPINGTSASELRTALGTILTFQRSGVRYVLAGSVTPAAIEALAKGL